MKKAVNHIVKSKRFRVTAVAVILAILFLCCSGFIVSQAADIKRLKNQEAAYTEQLNEQLEENEELEEILNSDDYDAYIEQKAREKGYVKSGEIVFYDAADSSN